MGFQKIERRANGTTKLGANDFKLGSILSSLATEMNDLHNAIENVAAQYREEVALQTNQSVQVQEQLVSDLKKAETVLAERTDLEFGCSAAQINDIKRKAYGTVDRLVESWTEEENKFPQKERLFVEDSLHKAHYPLLYEYYQKKQSGEPTEPEFQETAEEAPTANEEQPTENASDIDSIAESINETADAIAESEIQEENYEETPLETQEQDPEVRGNDEDSMTETAKAMAQNEILEVENPKIGENQGTAGESDTVEETAVEETNDNVDGAVSDESLDDLQEIEQTGDAISGGPSAGSDDEEDIAEEADIVEEAMVEGTINGDAEITPQITETEPSEVPSTQPFVESPRTAPNTLQPDQAITHTKPVPESKPIAGPLTQDYLEAMIDNYNLSKIKPAKPLLLKTFVSPALATTCTTSEYATFHTNTLKGPADPKHDQ